MLRFKKDRGGSFTVYGDGRYIGMIRKNNVGEYVAAIHTEVFKSFKTRQLAAERLYNHWKENCDK